MPGSRLRFPQPEVRSRAEACTSDVDLAIMSLMQTLANDDSPDMSTPRAALLKRLDEMATKDWMAVLREGAPRNSDRLPVGD